MVGAFDTLSYSLIKYHRILGGTSLLLYLCATLHVSAAFRQELEAFIFVPPGAPAEYASLYFAQEALNMASMKNSLYTTVVSLIPELKCDCSCPDHHLGVHSRPCPGLSQISRIRMLTEIASMTDLAHVCSMGTELEDHSSSSE